MEEQSPVAVFVCELVLDVGVDRQAEGEIGIEGAQGVGESRKDVDVGGFLLEIEAAGIAAIYLSGTHDYLSLQAIADNRDLLVGYVSDHLWLSLAVYALAYIVVVAFSLPGAALLTILGGFLFGPIGGGVLTVIAATIGATAVFLIARSAFGDILAKKAGPWVKSLAGGFKDDAFNYLMFPIIPL